MFNLIRIENGNLNVPEPLYYNAKAGEEIKEGEALVMTAGALTKCGPTAKPEYIAMGGVSASAEKREIPVCRVEANQVYETSVTFSDTAVPLVVGTKVKLDTDGMGITDVTASGVATIVNVNGAKTTGDYVTVRFQ